MITLTTRADNLDKLRGGSFDVLIAGGGINGAGIARDLALRDPKIKVALVEKNHFGSGTSGKNSHLIHGGLRYLKYFDFGLVREALRERAYLLKLSPHMVQPIEFFLPLQATWEKLYYRVGLTLYDVLAGANKIAPHRSVPGGVVYSDARVQAARLVLENIFDAIDKGVCAVNYASVVGPFRSGTVALQDHLTGEQFHCDAATVIDASGAWSRAANIRLVRGSHLVFPQLLENGRAISYFGPDGRIVFFVPFGTGDHFTLVGTTEADHAESPDAVKISPEETVYLRDATRAVLKTDREPISSFSSLRPLVLEKGQSATATSREHRIWRDDAGVVRVTGGKYTTYRLMSEEAVDLAFPNLARVHPTRTAPLHRPSAGDLRAEFGEAAPIVNAARYEMAQRLVDVLFVSTTWGYECQWTRASLKPYATVLGECLGWTKEQIDADLEATLSALEANGVE